MREVVGVIEGEWNVFGSACKCSWEDKCLGKVTVVLKGGT